MCRWAEPGRPRPLTFCAPTSAEQAWRPASPSAAPSSLPLQCLSYPAPLSLHLTSITVLSHGDSVSTCHVLGLMLGTWERIADMGLALIGLVCARETGINNLIKGK